MRDDGSDTTAAVTIVRRFVSEDQVGAHGPIKMSADDHYGRDIRSTVLVQVKNGQWHLAD